MPTLAVVAAEAIWWPQHVFIGACQACKAVHLLGRTTAAEQRRVCWLCGQRVVSCPASYSEICPASYSEIILAAFLLGGVNAARALVEEEPGG